MQMKRGRLIRGIAAEERFVDEIILVCLVITLTSLQKLLKIRSIQGTKEKTASPLSSFPGHEELLTAYSVRFKA
jgi:hypothetical protein